MSFNIVAKLDIELSGCLAQGGFGTIYLGKDPQLNAPVVVKSIHKERFQDLEDDYFAELKKLYASKHHNVAGIMYGCFSEPDYLFVMPYYKNGSLGSRISREYLTAREIIRYSLQFLSGVNHIHSKGLIHYDIKPDNILLSDSNVALVSDFGLAKYTDRIGLARQSGTTEPLAPPEYFTDEYQNIRFDIYQSGMCMYMLCNGLDSFWEQFEHFGGLENFKKVKSKIMSGKFPNRSYFLPHVPKQLRRVVKKALGVSPDDRYATALEMINSLALVTGRLDWRFLPIDDEFVWKECNELDGKERTVTAVKSKDLWNVNLRVDARNLTSKSAKNLDSSKLFANIESILADNTW